MNYLQAVPFDTNKGGNVPLLCLDNVRRGFSIANKYPSAWQAWLHTQQHTDPVPTGLDVPLFYSYTATIDGVTENYGHINVRLKNGTVWSDGNIYSSIEAYTSNHAPKYVGWGESVNDFKIIGEDMGLTPEQVNKLSVLASFQESKANPGVLPNVGLDLDTVLDNFLSYPTTINFRSDALAYREGINKATELKKGLYEVK